MESTNKILPENAIPKPKIIWKVWTLATFSFLLQTATWYVLHYALTVSSNTLNWIYLALVAAAGISVTTFFLLINKSRYIAELLIVLSAASYFFLSPHNLYVWIGGLIFALFALWYEERLRREVTSRIDFSVTRVIGGSVSILIYAILILLGFNIYNKVSADFKANPDKYYNRLGQQAAKTVPYFTKALPNNVDLNQSLGSYLEQEAKTNPGYKQASNFEKQIILNEVKQSFESQFQVTASNNDSLVSIMTQVVVGKIRQIVEPYQDYIPIIFTILIVGVLYTFAFLIRWIVLIISWLLFELLKSVGFFKLIKVQVEVEKLEI
jgi:hypothetical protein